MICKGCFKERKKLTEIEYAGEVLQRCQYCIRKIKKWIREEQTEQQTEKAMEQEALTKLNGGT